MSALILKDMYVLLKQVSFILFLTPFILTGEINAIIFVLFVFSALPMTAMAYDEQAKWNSYATMMPYSKKELVVSKFVLGYIFVFGAIVVSSLIGLVLNIMKIDLMTSNLDINSLLLCVSVALMFIALQLFVNFKFGVEKGRIIYILGFAGLGALNGFVNSMGTDAIMELLETPPIIFFGISIIINLISITLSIKLKNKE